MPGVRVNGVRLHYEEHGAGAPIALIHGCGGSALRFAAVEELWGTWAGDRLRPARLRPQ